RRGGVARIAPSRRDARTERLPPPLAAGAEAALRSPPRRRSGRSRRGSSAAARAVRRSRRRRSCRRAPGGAPAALRLPHEGDCAGGDPARDLPLVAALLEEAT